MLSCVRLLTVFAFRLNSRDYLRDRSTTEHLESSFNLSSIRVEPRSEALGSKARQPSVSINVHNSITTDFGQHMPYICHDVEPTFDNRKTVGSKHLATPRLKDVLCCRIQVSPLFKGSADCRNQAHSFLLSARSWSNFEPRRSGLYTRRDLDNLYYLASFRTQTCTVNRRAQYIHSTVECQGLIQTRTNPIGP